MWYFLTDYNTKRSAAYVTYIPSNHSVSSVLVIQKLDKSILCKHFGVMGDVVENGVGHTITLVFLEGHLPS